MLLTLKTHCAVLCCLVCVWGGGPVAPLICLFRNQLPMCGCWSTSVGVLLIYRPRLFICPLVYDSLKFACVVQDFLQVLSMFNALDFHWPPSVKDTYNAVSLVNFNLELTAPECSVSLGYEAKWWVIYSRGCSTQLRPALCSLSCHVHVCGT